MKTTKWISNLGAVATGVIGLSSSGNLWAAPGHGLMHDRGTIQAIEPQKETFMIRDRHEASLGFRWDSHTQFFEHGKPIVFSALKPGELVSVAYEKKGDTLVAETVHVLGMHAKAAPHAKTTS